MRAPILALAFLALPAAAQPPADDAVPATGKAPPLQAKVTVAAGHYQIDPAHTQVLFTVRHLGVSLYTGQFTQPTGGMTLDPAHPENDRVEVAFPIAKVSTTVPALDAHLQKPEFFDATHFPEGRFVATAVSLDPAGGNRATITGSLTLKGTTRPVVLQARFTGAATNPMTGKANGGFTATTTVKRSEFGVSYGLPMVSDEVTLRINAAFERQGG